MMRCQSSIRFARKLTRYLSVVLMCGLLSVSGSRAAPDKVETQTESKSQAQTECPSHEFHRFLQAFAASVEIQKKFTKFPLTFRYTVGEIGSVIVTPREVIKHPTIRSVEIASFAGLLFDQVLMAGVFPSEEEERSAGTVRTIERSNNRSSSQELVVSFVVPISGKMRPYYFYKTEECWLLRFIEAQ